MSILRWVVKTNPAAVSTASACQQAAADDGLHVLTCDTSASAGQATLLESHATQTTGSAANLPQQPQSTSQPELLPERPNQPVLSFPQRTFGKQRRAFSSSWYSKYPWLHYHAGPDNVLCFYCMVADKRSLVFTHNRDDVFSRKGFSNWKKALD